MKNLRKNANKKQIEKSEERYRSLLKASLDGYWLIDTGGRLLEVNEAYCRMSGYSEEELLTMYISDLEVGETSKRIAEHVKQVIEKGSDRFESIHRRKDGTVFDVEVSVQFQAEQDGQGVCFLRDITDNKLLQDRLQSLWSIAQMTEASPKELCDLVLKQIQQLTGSQYSFFGFISDDQKTFTIHSWSKEAMAQCGVQNKPIHYDISNAGMWSRAVIEKKPRVWNDYSLAHHYKNGLPDGHVSINNLLSVPIVRNNKVIALAAVANKTTHYTPQDTIQIQAFTSNILLLIEKRIADQALKKSDKRLKLALDSVSDAVWDWRVDTGEIYLSSRWYTMLGYEPYELPQSLEIYRSLIHPADLPRSESTVFNHLESGEPFEIEYRMRTKDNQWRWIFSRGKTVEQNDQGKPARMLGTNIDITERIRMNRIIQTKHRMEAIGTLAGGIAHDFNNILFPICGYAEILLEDIPIEDPRRKSVEQIHSGAIRASELVSQILAFSRNETAQVRTIKIQHIVKEVLKLLRSIIPTTIEIRQRIDNKCCAVDADPTQIHQIIMNLATNAYHAMENTGGTLVVSLEEFEYEKFDIVDIKLKPGTYVCLTVKDDGVGIPKDVINKIFDPFFTTKEKGRGTGMGLSVVHGIVTSLGGEIKVYSEPDLGTEINVYLPATKKTLTQTRRDAQRQVQGGTEHILLVDDEKSIRMRSRGNRIF